MTVNEHQSNVSFCCEMSWGLMRNLTKKRKEQAVLKLLKIFAVWEILIETGYFFFLSVFLLKQIGILPSENNSRSRKKLSIVKVLLWNEEKEKTKSAFKVKGRGK